jgi:acyl-coenzyme A thioesterase PaaI-like protein
MRCEAYQVDRSVAFCVATFMRMGGKGVKSLEHMTDGIQIQPYKPEVTLPANFKEVVTHVRATRDYSALTAAIPYAQLIGVRFQLDGDDLMFMLPRKASNIGNPILPAIHGGVIGGFMELSSALYLLVSQSTLKYPKIIDFSLDYLRAGQDQDTYAYCQVTRQGGRVANVEVHAWQASRDKPIALARAHFLLED